MGPGGRHFEVQIRTEEMHRVAEEGIAAHWKYKEGRRGAADDDQRVAWLRQLVEWQNEMRDPAEFMSTLKVDLYPEEVYTFTPRGRVIVLPRDATPIDFAYAIHSDVGNTCTGAKVNGRIVQLKYGLHNGDVVEILTQPGHLPSKDWLAVVKTSRARNKIKHVINTTERVKAIEIGEKYLEREARRFGVSLGRIPDAQVQSVAADYGCSKIEDLHAALGYGKYSARQVLQKLAPDLVAAEPPPEPAAAPQSPAGVPSTTRDQDLVIKVKGMDDLLVYRAKCCNPIRGEEVIGYITRGKGVAVHSKNCPNVQNLLYDSERKIDVEWVTAGSSEAYAVPLTILTEDRPGMLAEIAAVISDVHSNILNVEARTADERGTIDITVEIPDMKHLERVIASIKKLDGVYDVSRSSKTANTSTKIGKT
jgi:GTP pyrophosphokinase